MGELDVGQAVTLSPEVVAARLRALENLVSDLDGLLPRLEGAHQRQGTGMWTTIPECESFGQGYAATISVLHTNLVAMREQVLAASQSLAASAAALTQVDQSTRDRITALISALDAAPPTAPLMCTPYDLPVASADTPAVDAISGNPWGTTA